MKTKNNTSQSTQDRSCLNCGKSLIGKRNDAKFCNTSCRSKHHTQNKQQSIISPSQQLDGYTTPGLMRITSGEKENKNRQIKQLEVLKANCKIKLNAALIKKKANQAQIQQLNIDNGIIITLAGSLGGGIAGGLAFENNLAMVGGAVLGGIVANSFTKKTSFEEQVAIRNRTQILYNEIQYINRIITNCNAEIFKYNDQTIKLQLPNGLKSEPKIADSKKIPELNNAQTGLARINDASKSGSITHNEKVLNCQELLKIDHPEFKFSGVWFDLFGNPATNFFDANHGKPGSGKSTFALKFANYLAINFGLVIYISGEEGHSKTIQDKVKRLGITTKNLFIADLRTFEETKAELKKNKYHFIFIDSLDTMKMGPEEMKELRQMLPNNAFITISQSTKDGKMRGSNELIHDCDVVIQVENGVATTTKNRFKESGKTYEIF